MAKKAKPKRKTTAPMSSERLVKLLEDYVAHPTNDATEIKISDTLEEWLENGKDKLIDMTLQNVSDIAMDEMLFLLDDYVDTRFADNQNDSMIEFNLFAIPINITLISTDQNTEKKIKLPVSISKEGINQLSKAFRKFNLIDQYPTLILNGVLFSIKDLENLPWSQKYQIIPYLMNSTFQTAPSNSSLDNIFLGHTVDPMSIEAEDLNRPHFFLRFMVGCVINIADDPEDAKNWLDEDEDEVQESDDFSNWMDFFSEQIASELCSDQVNVLPLVLFPRLFSDSLRIGFRESQYIALDLALRSFIEGQNEKSIPKKEVSIRLSDDWAIVVRVDSKEEDFVWRMPIHPLADIESEIEQVRGILEDRGFIKIMVIR